MAEALESALRTHTRPRRLGWVVVPLVAVVLIALPLWFSNQGVTREERHRDEVPKEVVRGQIAERAQLAWDNGDVSSAWTIAKTAANEPLSRGVLSLTRAAGVPEKLWLGPTAAGCTTLAVLDRWLACGSFGEVLFFNADDGTSLPRLQLGPLGWQHAVVAIPSAKQFAIGGDDGVVRLIKPGNPPQEGEKLLGLGDSVRSLALSPDETELVVGMRDGSVLRWKMPEMLAKPLFKLKGPVVAVAWSRDGLIAATGRESTRVVKADDPSSVVLELDRPSRGLAFSASWPLYLTAGRDVMAVAPKAEPHLFSGARHDISALAVLGNRLLATSMDGAVQSWTTDGASLGTLHVFDVGRVALAAEPSRAGEAPDFYAASGKQVQAWRWKRERFTQPPPELRGEPSAFTFTTDGVWCAGQRDGTVSCREPGRVPATLKHAAPVVALAVAKKGDGWVSLTAAEDGSVALLVPNAEPNLSLSRLERTPLAVALSTDGQRAAVSWDDGELVFFSLEYGKEISKIRDANAVGLAFSADGRMLAAARTDKLVVTYLADEGREVQKLEAADAKLRAVVWSPDGSKVAAGGDDKRVTVWRALEGKQDFVFTGPEASVGAVAWSKDGARLAAMSDDGEVRIWQVGDARPEVEIRGHFGAARAVGFSERGEILEAGTDGVPRALNTSN
jgi:WD40 repeat protein